MIRRMITRAEWGAEPPRGRTLVNWPLGVDLWVHHTAGPQDQSVASIQHFHKHVRNWSDIGYSYLGRFTGEFYEGRGFEVHGAHSPGKNHEPSISLIGNYTDVEPSDEQHRLVYELMDFLDAGELRGHRENSLTTCPGNSAFNKIVQGPPPDMEVKKRPVYYFEELPFPEGGHGPQIVGQAKGYKQRSVMIAKLATYKALNPTQPVSTLKAGDDGTGDDDETRYYILAWKVGTYGTRFRFGPWRDEEDRDFNQKKREHNTGRQMRAFRGRRNSIYPYPSV